jgi:signal transduction histidine kinase
VPRLRGLLPNTFRARLTLAFLAVVAIALALVLLALPRLLDDYFVQQEQKNLATRAATMRVLLGLQLRAGLGLLGADPDPIILPTDPSTLSPQVLAVLGAPDDPSGLLYQLTAAVAQADVTLTIFKTGQAQPPAAGTIDVPATMIKPEPGQLRDQIVDLSTFSIEDPWWTQSGSDTPERLVQLRLSNPFTSRAQTLKDVIGVLVIAAAAAMLVAILISAVIADRLTGPIRRLTQASRSLGEGDFGQRVAAADSGAPEITELAAAFNRMAERLEESVAFIRRDRDRSRDFVADVSHELRTPIAALRTFNELLQEGADDDPAARAEFIASSQQQIERLDWLSTNLLELSKIDSGLVALDLRPDDLRAVVEAAIAQAEPSAKRRKVELATTLPRSPVRQRHDPQRVGQVLTNLIGNALKFTPAGGRVTVSLRAVPEGAELRVVDTGVGIDPAELPHVFDRFYRGSRASQERAGGSGLGLAIVRSIVEMHGGRVTIESTLGKGTEATVFLPREVAQSSPGGGRA